MTKLKTLSDKLYVKMVVTEDVIIASADYGRKDFVEFDQIVSTVKKHPNDKFNLEIGKHLALSRLFQKLAKKHQKQADGLTKCITDNKKASDLAKEKNNILVNFLHEEENLPQKFIVEIDYGV